MKIGYLTYNLDEKSGWGRYASDLILQIKARGHEIVVLKEKEDGHEGHVVLKRGLAMLGSLRKICRLLKTCDVIHALDVYPYGIIAYVANIFLRKKLVISAIGTYSIAPFYNPKTKLLARVACRSADAVVAISAYTSQELLKQVSAIKVRVIHPGIDFDRYYQSHVEMNTKFILGVGALKRRKGYHISIPAFAEAKKTIPDLRYKIVGHQLNKGYLAELKELVQHLGIENDVDFLENVSDADLKKLYTEAKLFILTSTNEGQHFEGFGLVFLEAAASGLPVIGTKGNGIEDAVGDNGILIPQNDIDATAQALRSILTDSTKTEEMSSNSYRWAKSHDIKELVQEFEKIYISLAK